MKARDFKSLSRTLTQIENGGPKSLELLKTLYPKKRGTPVLGITGLPGAGKSTLVDQLIQLLRSQNKTVGVIAVDPSSPFTGGALLGDRVRMQRHASDEGVFIRSLGTRGAHGGLSRATRDFILCFDAFGMDEIIVETVGVGQTELNVMGVATTTVVVLVPEAGDAIQTLKAGLMEIADIFVVNKRDRPGADQMQKMLQAASSKTVLMTEATQGKGIQELWETIENHRVSLKKDAAEESRKQELRRAQFLELVGEAVSQKIQERLKTEKKWKALLDQVTHDQLNPFEALEKVVGSLTK